jgi:hypothetical protein
MKFIEFVKRAKMYFVVLGIVVITIIGFIVYGLLTQYDRGFLTKDGYELFYDKTDLPVQFSYTKDVPIEYLNAVTNVVNQLNNNLGFKLIRTTLIAWDNENSDIEGTINALIDIYKNNESNPYCGGTTIVKSDTKRGNEGKILAVHIKLKNNLRGKELETAVRHEIGHALGLDHDDKSTSVMNNYIEGKLKYFTDRDINRLKELYKKFCVKL